MTWRRHPVPVRGLVMEHHEERLRRIPVIDEVESLVRNDICHVSLFRDMAAVFVEVRVVIVSLFLLSGKYAPEIEALRFRNQVPLPYHGCLVSGLLQELRKSLLVSVECAGIVGEPVHMTELSCQDAGSGRTGQCIDCIAIVEPHSFPGQTVHVRCLHEIPAIAGHGLGSVVIGHDEYYVRTLRFLLSAAGHAQQGSRYGCQCSYIIPVHIPVCVSFPYRPLPVSSRLFH